MSSTNLVSFTCSLKGTRCIQDIITSAHSVLWLDFMVEKYHMEKVSCTRMEWMTVPILCMQAVIIHSCSTTVIQILCKAILNKSRCGYKTTTRLYNFISCQYTSIQLKLYCTLVHGRANCVFVPIPNIYPGAHSILKTPSPSESSYNTSILSSCMCKSARLEWCGDDIASMSLYLQAVCPR